MNQEQWVKIDVGDCDYYISSEGRFKSVGAKFISNGVIKYHAERLLKPSKDTFGYIGYRVQINGKQYRKLAHRLIAGAFIPNPDNKPMINHLNGIKDDNRVENLEWCTRSENAIHSFKIGLQCNKGIKHPQHKLTEDQVKEIRSKYKSGRVYSTHKIAKEYGMSATNAKDIINRKTWNHI